MITIHRTFTILLTALGIFLVLNARADEEQSILSRVLKEQGVEYLPSPGEWDSDFLWLEMEGFLGEYETMNGAQTLDKNTDVAQVILKSWDKVYHERELIVVDVLTCKNFPAGSVNGVPTPVEFLRNKQTLTLKFSHDRRWSVIEKLVWLRYEILKLEGQIEQMKIAQEYEDRGGDLGVAIEGILKISFGVDRDVAAYGCGVVDAWRIRNGVKGGEEEIARLKQLQEASSSYGVWKMTDRGRKQADAWTAKLGR